MRAKPRVVLKDETHCQCVYDNVFVLYTLSEASSDNIDKLVLHFDAFAEAAVGKVACVIITSANTKPPDGHDRRKVSRIWSKHADKLAALAIILQAEGFRGSIIRSVAAGIFVLPNPGFPTKFFGKPHECTGWVSTQLDSHELSVKRAIDFALDQFEP